MFCIWLRSKIVFCLIGAGWLEDGAVCRNLRVKACRFVLSNKLGSPCWCIKKKGQCSQPTNTHQFVTCKADTDIQVYMQPTAWSAVGPEKLTVPQPAKKFPTFCGTRMFIAVFTRVLHLSLSWARSIQSIALYPISLRLILRLTFYLRAVLPSRLFLPDFPHQTQLCSVF